MSWTIGLDLIEEADRPESFGCGNDVYALVVAARRQI
jgi:hypothetical protein